MRLMRIVLPCVLVVAGAKTGLELADIRPLEMNALMSGIVAANVFLLGFLLAGTLSDFKESERVPGDLAASLDALADEFLTVAGQGNTAALGALAHLRDLSLSVREWLCARTAFEDPMARVRGLSPYFTAIEGSSETGRLKGEQAGIRKTLIRIDSIRSTSFVGAGYLIASLTTAVLIGGLLISDVGPAGQAAFLVGIIALLLVYMNLLIRDLDNPFEYGDGTAEVSLEPLRALERRLAEAIAAAGSSDVPEPAEAGYATG